MVVSAMRRGRSRSVSSIPCTPAERLTDLNRIITQRAAFERLQTLANIEQQCHLTIDIILASMIDHRPSKERTNRFAAFSHPSLSRTVISHDLRYLDLLPTEVPATSGVLVQPTMIARMLPAALELSATALDIKLLTHASFPQHFAQHLMASQAAPSAVLDFSQSPAAGVVIAKHLLKRYGRASKTLCNHIGRFLASQAEHPTAAATGRAERVRDHGVSGPAEGALVLSSRQVDHQERPLVIDGIQRRAATVPQHRPFPRQDARYAERRYGNDVPPPSVHLPLQRGEHPRWCPPAPQHFYSRRPSSSNQAYGPRGPPPPGWSPPDYPITGLQLGYRVPYPGSTERGRGQGRGRGRARTRTRGGGRERMHDDSDECGGERGRGRGRGRGRSRNRGHGRGRGDTTGGVGDGAGDDGRDNNPDERARGRGQGRHRGRGKNRGRS